MRPSFSFESTLLPTILLTGYAVAQSSDLSSTGAMPSPYTSSSSQAPRDNNAACSCYMVQTGAESINPAYFESFRFYDFRNLPDALSTPPPVPTDYETAGLQQTAQPNTFSSTAWTADWAIQNWTKPATTDSPINMTNSPANVYIGQDSNTTWLTLRTSRAEDFQSAAEIENTRRNLKYVSMRMHARVRGSPGAVAGFFTYFNDDNESDVEILTRDPSNTTRYTNQPSVDKAGNEIPGASHAPTDLPSWQDWQTHRIDWLPGSSIWYINNQQVASSTYSVPDVASMLVLNIWGDGGTWSGNMTVGDSAEMEIQWIELAFNTSGGYNGPLSLQRKEQEAPCQTVCKIDDVAQVGTPEVVGAAQESSAGGLSVPYLPLAVLVGSLLLLHVS